MKYAFFLYFFSLARMHNDAPQLPEYESFSHIDAEKYLLIHDREIDKDGIITQKGVHHALTVSVYGIMNYDAFMSTGDLTYYNRVIDQYKFFSDPTNLVFSDNNASAGLPYRYGFQGLAPPWVSGMTQGAAVSFLLRYYTLTKDISALKLSKQLMHLLLKDEKEGGTLSRTLEGGMWIEEYPNSKQAKSVLNGFINGLIGVHEYCVFFPEDKRAKTVRDSCYAEMIGNVSKYDKPDWTMYARYTTGGNITIGYLKYQLQEFDHLYRLYADERLRNEMRIWSRFAFNQPDTEIVFLKKPEYQFAKLLDGNPFSGSCEFSEHENFSSGLVAQEPKSTMNNVYRYHFSEEKYYCELKVITHEIESEHIRITAYQNGHIIKTKCTVRDSMIIIESDTPFVMLSADLGTRHIRKPVPVVLYAYNHRKSSLPMFGFYVLPNMFNLEKDKEYRFDFHGEHLTNATVFYRHGASMFDIANSLWSAEQSFILNNEVFRIPEGGVYQFFLSYDLTHPESAISRLQLVSN